jgi:hypothetical protein
MKIGRLADRDPAYNDTPYVVSLECVHSYVSGSGDNRSRKESIRWHEQGSAMAVSGFKGMRVSFRFDVPEGLPEADIEQSSDSYYYWRVGLKADLPGVDLDRTWNIPVYSTGEQSSRVAHNVSDQVAAARKQESDNKAAAIQAGDFHLTDLGKVVRVTKTEDGLRLYFPMFRNKVLTIFAGVFAGGFGVATWAINTGFGEQGGAWAIGVGLFSIPFGLVAFFAGLAFIYLPFNHYRVVIDRDGIFAVRLLLFLPVFWKKVSVSDVRSLDLVRSGSTGSGAHKIVHYKVIARIAGGGRVTLAEDVDGEDLAGHLKDYFSGVLKLDDGSGGDK